MLSRFAIAATTAGLVIAACGGSDDAGGATTLAPVDDADESAADEDTGSAEADGDTATTSTTSTTEPVATGGSGSGDGAEPEPEPSTTPAPDTTAAPETTEPAAVPATGPDCLIGQWVITESEMNAYYDALAANVDATGDLEIDTIGDVWLDLDGSNYLYQADFDIQLSVIGQSGTGSAVGTVGGTYEVTDGIITTTLGSSDLSVVVSVAGVTMDESAFAHGLLAAAPINDAPYECDGPTIGFQAAADPSVRHPVLLTPR